MNVTYEPTQFTNNVHNVFMRRIFTQLRLLLACNAHKVDFYYRFTANNDRVHQSSICQIFFSLASPADSRTCTNAYVNAKIYKM